MDILFILEILSITIIVSLIIFKIINKSRKKIKLRDKILLDNLMDKRLSTEEMELSKSYENDAEKIQNHEDNLSNQEFMPKTPSSTDKNFNEGLRLFKNKSYRESIVYFKKSIELNPAESSPYYYRGLAYNNMHMYNEAINDFTDAMLRQLNNPEAFYHRGLAWLKMGEKDDALRDLSEYTYLNKSNAEAFYLKGVLEFEKENLAVSIADFGNAIRLNPKHEGAYFKRGLARQKTGDMQGCCEDLQSAFDNGNLEAFHYIKQFCR
jgi:tetratricopeptide (TPR) repeat protein